MKNAGKIILENIAKLFKVKSLITIAIIFTTCYLTIKGQVETATFVAIAMLVVESYFKKDDGKNNQENGGE